jgi:hypothetical protein
MGSKASRLAISYISLAATMKKTEFCLSDFQVNQTNLHIFEYWAKLILICWNKVMEVLFLTYKQWRDWRSSSWKLLNDGCAPWPWGWPSDEPLFGVVAGHPKWGKGGQLAIPSIFGVFFYCS